MVENEFVGRRFGTFVVGAFIEDTKPKLWYCQCDCGNIIKCSKHSITRKLKDRRCSKCDPVRVPIAPKDAVAGSIFKTNCGTDLIVIKYNKASDIEVQFSDFKTPPFQAEIGNLRKGKYKNPFCITVGKRGYIGSVGVEKELDKSLYVRWRSMIERADDPGDKRPCQKDISVCEEWFCFQKFRDWYYSQLGNEQGWEIDKDLLVFKNTHYSPETCILLPRSINGKLPKRTSLGAYLSKTGLWKSSYRDVYGNRKTVSGKDKLFVAATSISKSFLTIREIVEINGFQLENRAISRINDMTDLDFVLSELMSKKI